MSGTEPIVEASPLTPNRGRQHTWVVVGIAVGVAVLAVVGLGAMRVIRNVLGGLSAARRVTAGIDVFEISESIDGYMAANDGHAPENLAVLVKPDRDGAKYLSGFAAVPRDPWNNPYIYEPPREGRSYHIFTLGRDGKPGGEGEDADIDNFTIASAKKR